MKGGNMFAWKITSEWSNGIVIARNVVEAAKKWKTYSKKTLMQPRIKSHWNIETITNLGQIVGS